MATATSLAEPVIHLYATTASSVKKDGWRGIVRALQTSQGKLLVTNHNEPEAVILTVAQYTQITDALREALEAAPDPVRELRQNFDRRLAALKAPGAGERLRAIMANPSPLGGRVKAGSTY